MFDGLTALQDLDMLGVTIRIVLAVLCGGLIGLERESKHRPAGFRTHILICLGAAMATATGQYLYSMHYYTDIARLGAQVIAGVGFIGAGTIIMTKQHRVRGLTTAAGLWVAAIVGLCCGAGFYLGAIYATILVLLAELFFSKLEYRLLRKIGEVNVYVEYADRSCLDKIMEQCHVFGVKVVDVEVTKSGTGPHRSCAIFSLQIRKGRSRDDLLAALASTEGILLAEEI